MLKFGLVVTGLVGNSPVNYVHVKVAGGIRDHVNLEQNPYMAGYSGESRQGQRAGGDNVGVEVGAGEQAIGHKGEGDVHGKRLLGSNLAGGYGNLSHHLPPVLEEGGTVGEPETHLVRILNGDVGVHAHVQPHPRPEDVDGEIEIP